MELNIQFLVAIYLDSWMNKWFVWFLVATEIVTLYVGTIM